MRVFTFRRIWYSFYAASVFQFVVYAVMVRLDGGLPDAAGDGGYGKVRRAELERAASLLLMNRVGDSLMAAGDEASSPLKSDFVNIFLGSFPASPAPPAQKLLLSRRTDNIPFQMLSRWSGGRSAIAVRGEFANNLASNYKIREAFIYTMNLKHSGRNALQLVCFFLSH